MSATYNFVRHTHQQARPVGEEQQGVPARGAAGKPGLVTSRRTAHEGRRTGSSAVLPTFIGVDAGQTFARGDSAAPGVIRRAA